MNLPKLGENVPAWTKERRQPTKQELAAKHAADGGIAPPPVDPQSAAFFNGDDGTGEITVRRYNT